MSVEAEEFPLLEAVAREWLVKTQQISDGAVIACTSELCAKNTFESL
jgi:hypothetical protein